MQVRGVYNADRNRRRRGPFNNRKQGGERYDWRTEKSFFPLSCALPFRIIPSRMLFHLVRVAPSFPIAHDWLQGGMRGSGAASIHNFASALLGENWGTTKGQLCQTVEKRKEEKEVRQAGALGNSRVISMWVGWSRRRHGERLERRGNEGRRERTNGK